MAGGCIFVILNVKMRGVRAAACSTVFCDRWVCCCSCQCQCSDVLMPRTLLVLLDALANSVCSHAGESCCRRERHTVTRWHGRLESFPLAAVCAMLRGQDQPRWHRDGRTYCLQLTLLNLSLQVPLSCYSERGSLSRSVRHSTCSASGCWLAAAGIAVNKSPTLSG